MLIADWPNDWLTECGRVHPWNHKARPHPCKHKACPHSKHAHTLSTDVSSYRYLCSKHAHTLSVPQSVSQHAWLLYQYAPKQIFEPNKGILVSFPKYLGTFSELKAKYNLKYSNFTHFMIFSECQAISFIRHPLCNNILLDIFSFGNLATCNEH